MHTTKYLTSGKRIYLFSNACCQTQKSFEQKKNIETLFLLAALKLPAKNKNNYEQEIKLVQEKL